MKSVWKDVVKLKLEWYLIGFLDSQEGWNGEYPFCISDPAVKPRNLDEKLKMFLDMLKNKDENALYLINRFKKIDKENTRCASKIKDIVNEIFRFLDKK